MYNPFAPRRPSLRDILIQQGKMLMTISAEVQANLDKTRALTSIVQSVDTGMKALTQQVADLKNQIANQTPSLSAEDKAALLESAGELDASITTLTSDIPANTPTAAPTA